MSRTALIDVSSYPYDVEVPFGRCGKCGGKRVDVQPNWKDRPAIPIKSTT